MVQGEAVLHIADITQEADYQAYRARNPQDVPFAERAGGRSAVWLPLRRGDTLLGSFVVFRREVRPFQADEVALLQGFATQAVIAIENARLLHELESARQDAERERATMQAVIENVSDGLSLLRTDGIVLLINRAMAEINGMPAELLEPGRGSMAAATRWQFETGQIQTNHTTAEAFVAESTERLRSATSYDRAAARRPNGKWVEVRWRRLSGDQWLIVHRDVTELKRRELELEAARSEAEKERVLMRAILNNTSDGMGLFEPDGDIAWWNDALYTINSFPRALFGGFTNVRQAFLWQESEGQLGPDGQGPGLSAERLMQQFLAGEPVLRTVRRPNGKWVDIRWNILPDGRRLFIHRDVTELKQRELELEAARDAIEKARALMNTVLDSMNDGVILWDRDGLWAYANAAFCDIQQSSPERLALLRTFPGMMDALLQRRLIDTGFRDAAIERFQRADGTPKLRPTHDGRWVEGAFHRVADGGTLGMFRDVTRLKEQEDRLVQERDSAETARREAEAANQAKSTFLATMSHEIRTPMNGVLGMLEVLEHQDLTADQQATLNVVRESATSLLRIIDDILDFSKIDAGRMDIEAMPFSLSGVVDGAVETMLPRARQKQLALFADPPAGGPDWVSGDPTRVRQILFNLVGNAIKFTDRGFVRISVDSKPVADESVVVTLAISDSGIGMDAGTRARLFSPFTQADSSTTRRFGGTGLGLSIVRRLAQLMGGDVTADSTPNQGSRFTVTLRLGAVSSIPLHNEPAAPHVTAAPALRPRATRLLVADDHPINRQVITRQLELLGLSADVADDGAAALALWRQAHHAVVLLDLHMPVMDGYGFADAVRHEEAKFGLPRSGLIAVTADALKGEAERCFAAGMDGFLTKPVLLDALARTLGRWIPDAGSDASPALPSAGALFDPEALRGLFGADQTRLTALARTFAETAAREVADIQAASDATKLAVIAHRLKGAARMAGARLLAEQASRIEAVSRSGNFAAGQVAAEGIDRLLADTLRAMRSIS
jgi:signal transduction histidine kinase/CheY-like chemotaxis protein/HPt (histidine-containing phosphotransfer) domain-containing protein